MLRLAYVPLATLVSATTSGNSCPPFQMSVRLPPFLDPATNASNTSSPSSNPSNSWVAPPTGFYAGTWYVTNTSSAQYRTYGNLQWDLSPVIPICEHNTTATCPPGTVAGVINEISSFTPSGADTAMFGAIGAGGRMVASVRAYDTPRRLNFPDLNSDWDAVFDNTIEEGVPAGWKLSFSILYWGLDVRGWPYMIVHEALGYLNTGEVSAPVVDVISMSTSGPDEASLTDVLSALMDLGNEELTQDINEIGPTSWDYDLMGGPVICGIQCMANHPA